MVIFEKTIAVVESDLDDLNHVNNVRYVQWIQDISKEHWQKLASKTMQDSVAWVVMHHDISYKNAAQLHHVLRVKTFIAESRGATSTRVVEIYDQASNLLLVRSQTKWCLLNATTFKPMRIPEEISKLFHPNLSQPT